MDVSGEPSSRISLLPSSLYRCVFRGRGCSSGLSGDIGPVGRPICSMAYQSPRDVCRVVGSSHWLDRCQNQSVLVAMDNSTVVTYINKQGRTRSLPLCQLAMKILLWTHKHNIVLRARHSGPPQRFGGLSLLSGNTSSFGVVP